MIVDRRHCPTCDCIETGGRGRVDTTAPFYDLVLEVDRIIWTETTARGRATSAARRTAAARQEDAA